MVQVLNEKKIKSNFTENAMRNTAYRQTQ